MATGKRILGLQRSRVCPRLGIAIVSLGQTDLRDIAINSTKTSTNRLVGSGTIDADTEKLATLNVPVVLLKIGPGKVSSSTVGKCALSI